MSENIVTETDDGVRATNGIVACLRKFPDGRLRIVFDDAKADYVERPTSWKPTAFFTWTQLDPAKLRTMELSKEQLAEIGFNLVARLRALGRHRCLTTLSTRTPTGGAARLGGSPVTLVR